MKRAAAVVAALAIALLSVPADDSRVEATSPRPAAFVEAVQFFEPCPECARPQIIDNRLGWDISMFAASQAEREHPDAWTIRVAGTGVFGLLLNPVPVFNATSGAQTFNVFALPEVREAMNWLVDRDFIVGQVFGGRAVPQVSVFPPDHPEYARQLSFFQQLDRNYSYDPVRARSEVTTALLAQPGVTQVNGRFQYQGAPLTVRFVIRIEDVRLDIGNYVADQLESIGITVTREYSPAAEAFNRVYFGPPDSGAWHIYTEGFTKTGMVEWQEDWIYSYVESECSRGQGWEAFCPPQELHGIALRLLYGEYGTEAERASLIRRGAQLALRDGFRVSLVVFDSVFAINRRVVELVYDLGAGVRSPFTVRTARFESPGGTLRVMNFALASPWNPVRGFFSLADQIERNTFSDQAMWPHPHTGRFIPVRAEPAVVTAGRETGLDVPADAIVWDTLSSQWQNIGGGRKAVSKVTFNYTFGTWHDGSSMDMNDVLVKISHLYRLQGGEDRAVNPYDPNGAQFPIGDLGAIDPRGDSLETNSWLGSFKGLRVIDEDTLEVYTDFWHGDPMQLAGRMSIWPTEPWTAWELMANAVLRNRARYDVSSAASGSCPENTFTQPPGRCVVLDLARGNAVAYVLPDVLASLKSSNWIPAGFGGTIGPSEAESRWNALEAFFAAHDHFYVSNGPFYLENITVQPRQTWMTPFADYPYPADRWDSLASSAPPDPSTNGTVGNSVLAFLRSAEAMLSNLIDRLATIQASVDEADSTLLGAREELGRLTTLATVALIVAAATVVIASVAVGVAALRLRGRPKGKSPIS